jgi:1-acyl-sn-glycerol-3-phosphate acyltransferase
MRTWFFAVGAWITGILLAIIGPARIEGLENVPRQGAFLVVANHCSNLDPPTLGWAVGYKVGRVVHFMAKDEMRRWPVLGWLAAQAGVFFVRRGEADRAAQRNATELLESGRPIALFPEGTRSRDGAMKRARPGAVLIAIRTGAPILPVGISGTQRLLPGSAWLVRRSRITVHIGEPLTLEHRPNGRLGREELAAESERVMKAVAALLPEEQRGAYRS